MFLSKHKSGYYYIYYDDKLNNKRRSISSKTKLKSEALSFLTNFRKEVIARQKAGVKYIKLEQFAREYLFYSSSIHTDKTTQTFKNTFNQLKKYFGSIYLTQISPTLINDFIKYRITSSSIYAARKDLINLSSAFNKAITDNYLKVNPCNSIKRIKLPEKQPKFFSREEYDKLLAVIDDKQFADMVEISANTGLRQMELITLKWEHVNLDGGMITLNNHGHITKGKKIRSIPLNKIALGIFANLIPNKKCEYVFSTSNEKLKPNYVTKKFKSFVRKAQVNPQLNWHSLRHSFASWLVQAGVGIYQISKLLGHADIKTTQIYAHVRAEDLRASINLLNQ